MLLFILANNKNDDGLIVSSSRELMDYLGYVIRMMSGVGSMF
jgi:hypothetical protein